MHGKLSREYIEVRTLYFSSLTIPGRVLADLSSPLSLGSLRNGIGAAGVQRANRTATRVPQCGIERQEDAGLRAKLAKGASGAKASGKELLKISSA